MKKKFESAEVRVIKFEAMDIMTASVKDQVVADSLSTLEGLGINITLYPDADHIQGLMIDAQRANIIKAASKTNREAALQMMRDIVNEGCAS